MKDLYVVNCCRTAIGSFGGSLKNTPAAEMGAIVVKEALNRAGVKPEQVDEVMFGCILTAALGQNVARQVSIKAGMPLLRSRLHRGHGLRLRHEVRHRGRPRHPGRRRRHRGLPAAPRTCPPLPMPCPRSPLGRPHG